MAGPRMIPKGGNRVLEKVMRKNEDRNA